MTLAANSLASVAEAVEYLDQPDVPPERDKRLIENLINRASTRIESYLDRDLKTGSVTEFYDGEGTATQYLRRFPEITLTSLNIDSDRDFTASTEIPTTDIVVDSERGTLRFAPKTSGPRAVFNIGVKNVKVVYTGGYSALPEDLKLACLLLVARSFMRVRQGAEGIVSESVAGYSASYEGITRESGFPLEVLNLIAPYRRAKNL